MFIMSKMRWTENRLLFLYSWSAWDKQKQMMLQNSIKIYNFNRNYFSSDISRIRLYTSFQTYTSYFLLKRTTDWQRNMYAKVNRKTVGALARCWHWDSRVRKASISGNRLQQKSNHSPAMPQYHITPNVSWLVHSQSTSLLTCLGNQQVMT